MSTTSGRIAMKPAFHLLRSVFAALAVVLLAGAAATQSLEKGEVRYQGWAGQVLFPELAEDLGYLATRSAARRIFRPWRLAISTSAALSTGRSSS
jgi:hypothetical protein